MFYIMMHMNPPSIGTLELAVLLSIVRLGDDAYGASLRRSLGEQTGRDHSVGAIYTTLVRLEGKGLVTSHVMDPTPVRGGRSKRCYRITALGSATLRHAREVSATLWKGVPADARAR